MPGVSTTCVKGAEMLLNEINGARSLNVSNSMKRTRSSARLAETLLKGHAQ